MKIEKALIYGFGKHQDLSIELNGQMTLFYGANEAGKTTIQQFIIQTLFGYPSRNQNLQRYEPKAGGKYGGQLHVTDPVYGKVIIERVKGKSAGEVSVYFEDGTRGSDAELKLLLRDYDRAAFESVFSFSVHELQGLEKMTEEELSRTLLASGTTGIDAVTKLEDRVEKEMAGIFKKTGRNPEINQLIEELRTMEAELKELQARTELYGPYIERLKEIEQRLNLINEEENQASKEMKRIEKWQQAAPLIQKEQQLQKELEALSVREFPSDGRRRMDRLLDRLSEARARKTFLEKEGLRIEAPDIGDLGLVPLKALLARESEWHQLRSLLRQKQEEAIRLEDDRRRLLSLIGMDETAALQADVSLSQEEELILLVQQADREEEENRYTDRKLAEEKAKLAEAEKELKMFLANEPSENDRRIAEEWQEVSSRFAEAKAAKRNRQSAGSQTVNYAFLIFGAVGLVISLWQSNFGVAGLSFLAAVGGLWLILRSGKPATLAKEHEALLNRYEGKEADYAALIQKLDSYDRKLDGYIEQAETAKRLVGKLLKEKRSEQALSAYRHFLGRLGIPENASRSTVLALFEKLREIHAAASKEQRLKEEILELEQRLSGWLSDAEALLKQPVPADELYAVLRSEMNKRQQQLAAREKRQEKAAAVREELEQINALEEQINEEQQALMAEARAANADAFYLLGDEWLKKEGIERELAPIQSQLQALGSIVRADTYQESNTQDIEALLLQLKKERYALLEEQAEKQQFTKQLLTDEAYEIHLQLFNEKKEELADMAKRWSAGKAITEAIRQTMAELKEKRLPAVIEKAQIYFGKLTSGSYEGMEMAPQGYFEAVRKDGMRFHIAELSQATKEQAYLSLRLALAASMLKTHPFPIIMDDAFVHFDRRRLQQMINLITELQEDHQFVYFTCHETMQQVWPDAYVIDVATIERSVYS